MEMEEGSHGAHRLMKILCVSHYYPPHVGGLEIVTQKQAHSLAGKGHTVSVVTCASAGETGGVRDEFGVTVHRVAALNIFDRYFGLPFPIAGLRLLTTMWKEVSRADIVHLHDVLYQTSWVAYFCAVLQHKPILLIQHVGLVEHSSTLVRGVERAVYALWGRRIFNYADTIVVFNETVKTFVAKYVLLDKIKELRNGIDLSLFRPASSYEKSEARREFGLPTGKPLILFVGRLVPKKGASKLIEARHSSYDLVFAGSGEVKPEWQALSGVHWLGPLTQPQLAVLYRAADIFVSPTIGEPFTLALQEACGSGLPVITTDEPAYRQQGLDRERMAFVKPTTAALKRAIQNLVADERLRVHMGAYSLELARERFNWQTNIGHLLHLYAQWEKKPRSVTVTTSWDDGHILDLKLATLLHKYGIRATFYISPKDREFQKNELLAAEHIKTLSQWFEIGAHTMTHPRLPQVSPEVARTEIVESKRYLEEVTGKSVRSFCYPRGEYTLQHKEQVRQAGYTLARTVQRFAYERPKDPYEMPTTIHTYDHWLDILPLARFVRFNPVAFWWYYRRWDRQALALFERARRRGGVFHLWGHSWEIEKRRDWERLERVLRYIGGRREVHYATNAELI